MLSLKRTLTDFLKLESAGGIIMIVAAALAMIATNSPLSDTYRAIIAFPIAGEALYKWVKDVLMVFFFLIIALELKREAKVGFLADRKQILLPLLAATGGMAIPAAFYIWFNIDIPENWAGWAIPSATDIAFALCVLTLAGRGVPPSIKIFLLAIAIFDDLGAILIIAFFYSGTLNLTALALAVGGVAVLAILNHLLVRNVISYLLVGIYLWFCLSAAGIHTTIAGVLVGLFIPMTIANHHSPLNRLMHQLHPWVAFAILPLFAFTSAGIMLVSLSMEDAFSPIALGIAKALFFGKQIGIFGVTWICIKLGLAKMPEGGNWKYIYGVSILAGVGFTMSLFVGLLAFPTEIQPQVKIGVISGSLLSTMWGVIVLKWARS